MIKNIENKYKTNIQKKIKKMLSFNKNIKPHRKNTENHIKNKFQKMLKHIQKKLQ